MWIEDDTPLSSSHMITVRIESMFSVEVTAEFQIEYTIFNQRENPGVHAGRESRSLSLNRTNRQGQRDRPAGTPNQRFRVPQPLYTLDTVCDRIGRYDRTNSSGSPPDDRWGERDPLKTGPDDMPSDGSARDSATNPPAADGRDPSARGPRNRFGTYRRPRRVPLCGSPVIHDGEDVTDGVPQISEPFEICVPGSVEMDCRRTVDVPDGDYEIENISITTPGYEKDYCRLIYGEY